MPHGLNIHGFRSLTNLPLILKGIMSVEVSERVSVRVLYHTIPQDALRGAEMGARALIVSNHGGRQLECAPVWYSMVWYHRV